MRNKGITLVALVVTIVIMLILVGVTLNIALGENGVFKMSKSAVDKYQESAQNEEKSLVDLAEQINNMTDPPTTIEEALERGKNFAKDGSKDVVDEFGNQITIPTGFHIVTHAEDETVDYDYSATKKGIPTVQDGIVIQDGDGNQFVWIPVGTIKNKENESTTEIKLGRYTFNGYGNINEQKTNGEAIGTYFTEDTNSSLGNAVAKNIKDFITSATSNGGYYLARYEAGVTNYDEENIKTSNDGEETNWTGYQAKEGTTLKLVSKKEQQVWNYITQNRASVEAKTMYPENNNYTSDLVNSYVWDTAIVFIQTYGGEVNKNYSRHLAANYEMEKSGPDKTGTTTDKVCNIYDMASNCGEWSTETSSHGNGQCVMRGGNAGSPKDCSSTRNSTNTSYINGGGSFRTTIYVK